MTHSGSYDVHTSAEVNPTEVDSRECLTKNVKTLSEPPEEAPDGGWGWAVVGGSALVNLLLCGHGKAFGVYFTPFMKTFEASASRVAWIQSLYMTTFTLTAPLASILTSTVGSRGVGLAGGVTACLGMALSSLAPNLEVLYLTYGVMQGVATSFTFTPGVMTVGRYFSRRRGLANGLNIAGNALGGIVMPLVVNALMENLGLRGGLLLMGAILLHACIGVSFWQPVEWHLGKSDSQGYSKVDEDKDMSFKSNKGYPIQPSKSNGTGLQRALSVDDVTACKLLSKRLLSLKYTDVRNDSFCFEEQPYKEIVPYAKYTPNCDHTPVTSPSDTNKREIHRWLRPVVRPVVIRHHKGNNAVTSPIDESEDVPSVKVRRKVTRTSSLASSFLYVSTLHLNPSSTVVEETESALDGTSSTASASSTATPIVERKKKRRKLDRKDLYGRERLEKTVFKNGYFYIFAFCLFFHQLGYPGTHTYLPMRGLSLGFSQQKSATLLSAVAFADFIGRVTCGWLSDLKLCPRKYWFMGGMFMSSVFSFSMQFPEDYVGLLLCAAAFGLSSGCYIGLVLALFGDMFGGENVGISYSMAVLFSGTMGMAGPPLLGFVLESTSSYAILQTILGSAQLLGCAVWLFEPLARRHENRKAQASSGTAV